MASDEKCPPLTAIRDTGEIQNQQHDIQAVADFNADDPRVGLLSTLLNGSTHVTAIMPWGKPGPIKLPDDPLAVRSLIGAHLRGDAATVLYVPSEKPSKTITVDPFVLGAYSPAADGCVRWLGIDLDGASHGPTGLADPAHAARCIAERADAAGLLSGLVVARSKSGNGRHCWMLLPYPVDLADAVLAVAQLAVQAVKVATQDVADGDCPHAFRCVDGSLATPGESGKVELFPRGDQPPPIGWALTLPMAGAFHKHGGGILVDPFTDRPVALNRVLQCEPNAWECFLRETRSDFSRRSARAIASPSRRKNSDSIRGPVPIERLPFYVRDFIDGNVREGDRGNRVFVAACALFGFGYPLCEVESLILQGARSCGLPEREARSAIQSAARRKGVQS